MNIKVEKKQKRKTHRWILLVIPVAVVIIFVGIYYVSEVKSVFVRKDVPDILPAAESSDYAVSMVHDELCTIELRNADEPYSVRIQQNDDEPYVLAYIDGEVFIDGDTDLPVKDSIALGIRTYATYIVAQDFVIDLTEITDEEIDYETYGLDHPVCTAEVTYTDGKHLILYFGNYTETDGLLCYYMKTDRSNSVYLVASDFFDAFSNKKIALRPVESPQLDISLIDMIDIQGDNDLCVSYSKGNWDVIRPVSYPADSGKIDKLLNRIADLRFYAYIGEKENIDPADYGLDFPRLTVDITMADTIVEGYDSDDVFHSERMAGETHRLQIGNDYNDVTFYCMYDNAVFIGTYMTVGFWFDVDPFDFYLANPVNIPTNALVSMTVNTGDINVKYTFDYIEHTDSSGQTESNEPVYDIIVYRDGKLIDSNAFFSWYSQLTAVSVSGKLRTGMDVNNDVPDISVLIETPDLERKIELVKTDSLNYKIYINGNSVFYVNISKIETITEMP